MNAMRTPGLLAVTLVVLLILVVGGGTGSAGEPELSGFWMGKIEVPENPLDVLIKLDQQDGEWKAWIDVPQNRMRQVEMIGVSVADGTVTLVIPGVGGDPTFAGSLDDSGDMLNGKFTLGEQSFAFRLARSEKPADYDADQNAGYDPPGAPGEGVVGIWRGRLKMGPQKYRLEMRIRPGEELSARVISVDQLQTGFDADSVEIEGNSIKVTVDRIQAVFSGALNDNGSELKGIWAQSGHELPLTFYRLGTTDG